jgi:hypothetical protein
VLSGGGQVSATGGVLLVQAPVSIPNFTLSGGSVGGSGVLTLTGAATWSGGSMIGNGTTVVADGATLAISGTGRTLSGGQTLEVAGTVNHTGTANQTSAALTFGAAAALTVRPGGTYHLAADGNLSGNGTITNQGLFVKTSPTGTGANSIGITFNNAGTLRIESGALLMTAGGTGTGAFAVANGARLTFQGVTTYVLGTGAAFSGSGQVFLASALPVGDPTVGTLRIDAPVSIPNFTLSGGTVGGPGVLTLTGASAWTGGTMTDASTTAVAAGATLTISGARKDLDRRSLEVLGTVNHTSGDLYASTSGTATLIVRPGGTYNLSTAGIVSVATVTNQGLFVKTFSTGTGANYVGGIFNNSGTLRVASGRFSVFRGTSTGVFDVSPGAELLFQASHTHYVLEAGATFRGTGLVNINTGARLEVNTPVSIASFRLDVFGGVLSGTGTVTLTGAANWFAGSMVGPGTTAVATGATLVIAGGVLSERTLEVTGTVNRGGLSLANASLIVRPGGIYNLDGSLQGTGVITNQGLFVKTRDNGSQLAAPVFNNAGTLRVDGGTLALTADYNQATGTTLVAAGATLQANVQLDSSTLSGSGTVTGNVIVRGAGTVNPGETTPGRMTVNGNLLLQPGGTLAVELNGPTAGTQYDQLQVSGSVILGGALNVSLGYTPAVGDGFTLLDNTGPGPITGTFAGLPQGAVVTIGGQAFTISYVGGTGNDVVLTRASGGPTVQLVAVNDGAAQRSMVTRLAVTFTTAVTFVGNPADAFQLVRSGGAAVGLSATTATVGGVTVATLTFSGPETENGSLRDGNYTLTVLSAQVNGMAPGNYRTTIHRLFGDADGDKEVDNADFFQFRTTFGLSAGQPGFLAYFDFDADGDVDNADFFQFRPRFGSVLP